MDARDRHTSDRLAELRAAVEALDLGLDGPDEDRLTATLTALDPALSADIFAPAAFLARTGLPAPAWFGRVTARRDALLAESEAADLPDEGLVHATALDPDLGRRLTERRRFLRYLRRHDMLRPRQTHVVHDAHAWWAVDGQAEDGRWVRVRWRPPQGQDLPVEAPFPDDLVDRPPETLDAVLPAGTWRRGELGPTWSAGTATGLWATRHTPDGIDRRLATADDVPVQAIPDDATWCPYPRPVSVSA